MNGRVCVVTGASSGIGVETARGLARLGATVAAVGRDPERTAAVADRLRTDTGNVEIHPFVADFSALANVRHLASELLARFERIDVLVNNAGLWVPHRTLSADGYELVLAVNHLAPYLLTRLLLDRLREGDDPRVVHVSSRLHLTAGRKRRFGWQIRQALESQGMARRPDEARLDLDDLHLEGHYHHLDAYARSKLAQIVFSNELARREPGVASNALHPGDVATEITRYGPVLKYAMRLAVPVLMTPAQGAATSLHLATSPAVRGVSGRYFEDCVEAEPSKVVHDSELGARLWATSAELVALLD